MRYPLNHDVQREASRYPVALAVLPQRMATFRVLGRAGPFAGDAEVPPRVASRYPADDGGLPVVGLTACFPEQGQ